ncbi:MAG TPA: helix-turn-helix domain-containing protein [Ktedonobacteraceae bacterium]
MRKILLIRIRLIEERRRNQMSQRTLADYIGTTQNNVSRWERGVTTPNPYFRGKLCDTFGKSARELDLLIQPGENASMHAKQQVLATKLATSAVQIVCEKQQFPLWNIPHPSNPFFTGRRDLLHHIHEKICYDSTSLFSRSQALSGLGGIGKTQTAIEYAYQYARYYRAIFWINAETPESIAASLQAISELLDLPEKEVQTPNQVGAAVVRWLNTQDHWLLIFDNVEDTATIRSCLPVVHNGSILFTSRQQTFGLAAHVLSLEKMTPQEGMYFLLHRIRRCAPATPLATDAVAAREIVKILDGLPLALDQAGAYIEETNCSLLDYLQLLQSCPMKVLDERGEYISHPLSVVKTFISAFKQLKRHDAMAAELLKISAFWESESIPEVMLRESIAQLDPAFQAIAANPFCFQAALKSLLTHSLLQRNPMTHTLTIHRLVQLILKGHIVEASKAS